MDVESRLNSLESRLADSERREARYRCLASITAVLAVGSMLFAVARPAVSDKLGTELKAPVRVVDREGKSVFEFGSGNGKPYLLMLNSDQEVLARAGGSAETGGGYFDILHSSGREAISLSTDDDGGLIRTFDKQHRPRVTVGANRFGGSVVLSDSQGSFAGWFHMRERGGVVQLNGKDLKSTVYLGPRETDSGELILFSPEDQKGTRIMPDKKQ